MVTNEWPDEAEPWRAPFLARSAAALRRAGVDLEVFAFRSGRRPSNYLRAWWRFRQVQRTNAPDLVHAQWGHNALVALPTSLPLVVTFRGSEVLGAGLPGLLGGALRWACRRVAQRADEVIVVSRSLARSLPRRRLTVIPSGLDLDLFRPGSRREARRELGLPSDQPLVLFAGDPRRPVKRFFLARAALARLPAALGAELVVARGLAPERIPLYLNACDVLLCTSAHEGSPNLVKEALACDLPVVSTRVGDVPQRLADLPNCAVVDPDAASIAAALLGVLESGRRGCSRHSVQDLDEKLLAAKIVAVYRRALYQRKPADPPPPRHSR